MNKGLFLAALAFAPAAFAETVTDDLGRSVDLPDAPQSIVSLHDTSLTVALLELGVMPTGSHGRVTGDGAPYIRSGKAVTGVDFDNSGIAFVGQNPADLEQIAAVHPDMILTTSWQQADVEQLSQIAPTYVFDIGKTDDFDVYARIAELTGTTDRLARMEARYKAQLDVLRSVVDTENTTVSIIQGYDGNLQVWNTYGTLGKMLRDAGFRFPDAVNSIEGNEREIFSGEALPGFDADWIFVTYRPERGESPETAAAALEAVLPGWCNALTACQKGHMIWLPRPETTTATYSALGTLAYMTISHMAKAD